MFSVDNHVQCINQNKCNVPKVPQNPDVTFVIFLKKKKKRLNTEELHQSADVGCAAVLIRNQ